MIILAAWVIAGSILLATPAAPVKNALGVLILILIILAS